MPISREYRRTGEGKEHNNRYCVHDIMFTKRKSVELKGHFIHAQSLALMRTLNLHHCEDTVSALLLCMSWGYEVVY